MTLSKKLHSPLFHGFFSVIETCLWKYFAKIKGDKLRVLGGPTNHQGHLIFHKLSLSSNLRSIYPGPHFSSGRTIDKLTHKSETKTRPLLRKNAKNFRANAERKVFLTIGVTSDSASGLPDFLKEIPHFSLWESDNPEANRWCHLA